MKLVKAVTQALPFCREKIKLELGPDANSPLPQFCNRILLNNIKTMLYYLQITLILLKALLKTIFSFIVICVLKYRKVMFTLKEYIYGEYGNHKRKISHS